MEKEILKDEEKQKSLLYDKEVVCPVCGTSFKVKSVKKASYRSSGKDSDFFIHYTLINPYFYDVWLCNSCGYAAMKVDFDKIKSFQKNIVLEKITPKWRGRAYKEIYDINIAVERYKLALLNYSLTDSKSSCKAMTCLKLAWMYRILKDSAQEKTFITDAVKGFNNAYFNEDFPIYGMDKFTVMYLIGELNRRLENEDEALRWFSSVITTPSVNQRLKEMAKDQKDLIKDNSSTLQKGEEQINSASNKKSGFFTKLFK